MFERVAEQQGWPKEVWSTQLGGLLSGEALDAFTSVPAESATNYDAVKEAILARYLVNAETYRLRFRDSYRRPGESYKLLLNRQTDLLKRWNQSAGSELKEIILLEQFLLSLPAELAVKLRERNPSTAKEAADWADDYNLAHMGEELPESMPQPQSRAEAEGTPKVPFGRGSLVNTSTKRSSPGSSLHSKTNTKGELQCFSCRDWGHIAAFCPRRKSSGVEAVSTPILFNLSAGGASIN